MTFLGQRARVRDPDRFADDTPKRGALVSVGDIPIDVPGVGRTLTAKRQAHHFTRLDQVTQLVAARDADPEVGFMARLLALCSLPRTNQGDRLQYIRRNGPLTLVMTAGFKTRLPYGTLPRLLLAWECTEAVRTQSRDLIGDSLAAFMRKLEIYNDGGAVRGRVQDQMRRLFNSHVQLVLRRCPRPSERVFAGGRSDRALVEPETARRSHAVGKFDQAWGRIFNEVIRRIASSKIHSNGS